MAKSSGNFQALQFLAVKIGLGAEEKVLSKAAEYERRLQMKGTSSSSISDTAKTVICLDLAAAVCEVQFDMKTAIKYSGVKPPAYANGKKMLENLLELTADKLTVALLCAQLHCDMMEETAHKILHHYQRSTKMDIDLSLPHYVCMAVHQASRINKVKVTKSKMLEKSRLKPGQWSKMEAEWTKFVDQHFAVDKKKKARQSNVDGEEPIEKMEIDQPKKAEEEETEPQIEPYEDWKRRILAAAYAAVNNIKDQSQDGIQPKAGNRELVTNKKTDNGKLSKSKLSANNNLSPETPEKKSKRKLSANNNNLIAETQEKNCVTERDNRNVENKTPNKRRNKNKIADVEMHDISDDVLIDETINKSMKLNIRSKLVKDNLIDMNKVDEIVDKEKTTVDKPIKERNKRVNSDNLVDNSDTLFDKQNKAAKIVNKDKSERRSRVLSIDNFDNSVMSPRRSPRKTLETSNLFDKPIKVAKIVDKKDKSDRKTRELYSEDSITSPRRSPRKTFETCNLFDKPNAKILDHKQNSDRKSLVLTFDDLALSTRRSPRKSPQKVETSRKYIQKNEPYKSPIKSKGVRLLFPSD